MEIKPPNEIWKQFIINSKHGNFIVLVDEEDYNRVIERKWSISFSCTNETYYRVESRINRKLIRLHRYILNITDPNIKVDHINRNTLDNRKSNLRICTQIQNMRNCKSLKNKTGFRGVYQNHGNGKFRACISIKNKTFHIPGNFLTAEEAAKVRDEYALMISGEFAVLNFPMKGGNRHE